MDNLVFLHFATSCVGGEVMILKQNGWAKIHGRYILPYRPHRCSEPVGPAGCWEHENETCHLLRLPGSHALSVSGTQERYLFYGRHDCQRDSHLLSRIFINKKSDLSKVFAIASSYIKYQNIKYIYIYIRHWAHFAIVHLPGAPGCIFCSQSHANKKPDRKVQLI